MLDINMLKEVLESIMIKKLEVNASILGATEFGEYALIHPNVQTICFL